MERIPTALTRRAPTSRPGCIRSSRAELCGCRAEIQKRKQLGIGAPGEDRLPYVPGLSGPDHILLIADGLAQRGQPSAVIEKVLGATFQRVLGEIWGTA